jgi:hypothetical protein
MTEKPQYRKYKEEWIQNFLSSDLVIFPCNLNKTPMISGWNTMSQKDSYELYNVLDDVYEIEKNIQSNIGLLCGTMSGIVVIDIDIKDGGMKYWNELLLENSIAELDTLKAISGSGGYHYFFEWTLDMENWVSKNRIFSTPENKIGIDFRADNGYIILPPSIHCDTANLYKFDKIDVPCNIRDKINLMPQWLFDKIKQCGNFHQ